MIKKLLIICMLFSGLAACDDPYENTTFANSEEMPNAVWLESRPEFSEWVNILKYGDMYNAINQASEIYTIFAPVNEAVEAFYAANGVASIEELAAKYGEEYVSDLIKFHIINQEITQRVFLLGGRLPYPTLSEEYLTVVFADGASENTSVFLNSTEVGVTEYANTTINGLVYVLDAVLPPLSNTLYDELNAADYTIFKAAVEATGLNARLSAINDTVVGTLGSRYTVKRKFTLLAVPDQVYRAAGINNVSELAAEIGAEDSNYSRTENELYQYVAYHLVSSVHFAEELFTFETDSSSLLWNTYATNQVILTRQVDGTNYINFNPEDSTGVCLIDEDSYIQAKNGIIYQVDGILPLSTPAAVTYTWDFCEDSQIESIVNTWGANNGFGNCYQQFFEYGTAGNTDISLTAYEIDIFDYEYTVSNNNWARVGYHLAREMGNSSPGYGGNFYGNLADGSFVEGSGAYKNDFLSLNLGYMGKISITSPTILKGKYRVTLQNTYVSELYTLAESGGTKVKFTLDDVPVETLLFTASAISSNSSYYVAKDVLWEEIEFTETSSHTFTVTLLDARASTLTQYHLLLDWLKFEPIEE